MHQVVFQPAGRRVTVLADTLLVEAAGRAGLVVQTPCAGNGTCGKCAVRVTSGECAPSPACREFFSEPKLRHGWRLACQARITTACTVEIPDSARLDSKAQILTTSAGRHLHLHPEISKKLAAGAPGDAPVTHVWRGRELLASEPGDTRQALYGVACDLGTTTIVAGLMDLTSGQEVAVAAAMNPQVALGDDVISRIGLVRENPAALADLRRRAAAAIDQLVGELAASHGIRRAEIYSLTLAGNTTMQHLISGVSPAALGEIPFIPPVLAATTLSAGNIGIRVHPQAQLHLLPNIGGFVGGDTVAGILATQLAGTRTPHLLVDIGTNGELVLAHAGKLFACSTAAGPAFEGARISAGMRAAAGAIDQVIYAHGDLAFTTIGNSRPAGLCGTGLIDLVAELLRLGVIDQGGRILPPDEAPATLTPAIRARLVPDGNRTHFRIATAAASRSGDELLLRQKDVRELQLASGAIRAGIILLLRQCGLVPDQLAAVLLAGGFGNFIRRRNARQIGLLPHLPTDRIRCVGNSSLMGAKATLLSTTERREADLIARQTTHVELSEQADFQCEFAEAMLFPEPDPLLP